MLIALALYAGTAAAHNNPESGTAHRVQLKVRKVKFTSYRLANGLRVLLAPDNTESDVAINISFDAGSKRESSRQAGASALIQNVLLQELQKSGIELTKPFEGVVNQERASYFSEFSTARLDTALSVVASNIRPPAITHTQIDAVHTEVKKACDDLGTKRFGRVQETLLELIYGGYAFKYGAVCNSSNRRSSTPAEATSFFKTNYVMSNAVLVIVGNFRESEAKSAVARHFGMLPRQATSKVEFDDQRFSIERRRILSTTGPSGATYLSAYLTVPSDHPDWYALNILADIIGQGNESRLYKALVAKRLASSVPEGIAESRGRSLFRIGTALLPGTSVDTVEAIIDAELERIRENGVTAAEIETARSQERQYSAEQLGTKLGKASFLARATLYYNDPNRINTELGRILAATAADVRRVARRYILKTNRAVAIVQPTN